MPVSMQGTELSANGLMRFYTKDELKRYLKGLVEHYQAQSQAFGDQLGVLLRTLEQEKAVAKAEAKENRGKGAPAPKAQARGWVKMGSVLVNASDPNGAMAEVLFNLHEDLKTKLAKATDALKSFEELGSSTVPEAGLYYLQLKNGVPERVVVDTGAHKRELFAFAADFKLV